MLNRIKVIIKIQSSLLILLAIIMSIPVLVVALYKEPFEMYYSYIIPAGCAFILGSISLYITRDFKGKIDLTLSMIICAIAWMVISLFGTMPFIIGLDKSFIDSFFESVSGFTSSGLTVFTGLEQLPHSILFFRALMQFVGGLGILTFFLFVTFSGEGDIWQLFAAEGHKINSTRPAPNIFKTIKILWTIYVFLTLIESLILFLLGLNLFDAITHSMTTIATGGFSSYDLSIGYFESAGYSNYILIEYVITFFMLVGGMNYLIHFKVITSGPNILKEDVETQNYLKIIATFTIVMILSSLYSGLNIHMNFEELFRKSLFQNVSLITSTGFTTVDINSAYFTPVAKQLFLILMVTGGCVGSTSGGIKVIRITILGRLFRREFKKIYMPRKAVVPVVVSNMRISDQEIYRVSGLFFGWLLIIMIGSGITAFFSDLDAFQSLSGMTSALGNTGPFYFSVEKLSTLSPIIKLTFIFGMLAGRLEILPIVVLFSIKSWKR